MAPTAGRTFRWIRPDVYPVLAAVGIGLTASSIIITRKLFSDPAVQYNKFRRGEDIDPERAERYRNSWHRRMFAGRVIGILPDPIKRKLPEAAQQAAKDADQFDAHAKA